MLLIFFLLLIFAAGLLITYTHYAQQKKYQDKMEEFARDSGAQTALQTSAQNRLVRTAQAIADGVSDLSFRPRDANEAIVKQIIESSKSPLNSIRLFGSNGVRVPVYMFIEQLHAAGTTIFAQNQNDAAPEDYRANQLWLYLGNEAEQNPEQPESIVLRIDLTSWGLERIMDSDKFQKYAVGEQVPCIDSIHGYVVGECAQECQTELLSRVAGIVKQCSGIQFIPNSKEGTIWIRQIDSDGNFVSRKMSYTGFDEAFFNAAYAELRTQGDEVKNVQATKLLNGLMKTWSKTSANICFFGKPGTGKSTLLKAIAKRVSDTDGMHVFSVSGKDFATHFSNPKFTSNLKANSGDEKIIVLIDEFHGMDVQATAIIKSVLDGLDSFENVSFVLATNEEKFDDPAITRSGRMEVLFSITPFQKKEDAETLYNLLVKQSPDVRWKPFPTGEYIPMTLADISGLKLPVSLWDAIQ